MSIPLGEAAPNEAVTEEALTDPAVSRGIARAASVVALGNVASRVLGLARETLIANFFGAGALVDAFRIAVIIPRSVFDLLIGGHASSALVPVFSAYASQHGKAALWQLTSAMLSLVAAAMAALVLLVELLAPALVYAVSSGASAEVQALASDLLRITAPAILFLSLATVLTGLLYALKRFSLPAFVGAAFNGVIVATTLLLADRLAITAMALGWLLGSVTQVLLQLPGLRDARLRFTLNWRHPGVRRIFALYGPVMLSLVVDVLILRPVSYNLASHTGEASISYMEYATQLTQLPHGLVATAISIAILPTLSRQAVALNGGFKSTLGQGLRMVTLLIVPAAVGLFVLAGPVINLILEHGEFTAQDTVMTTLALRLYLIGLPFAAIDLLLVYAFYAQQDTLTPALVGVFSIVVYMIVALSLIGPLGLFSLMIADSAKHVTHAGVSAYLLRRRIGDMGGQRLTSTTARALLASLVMSVVALAALRLAGGPLAGDGLVSETLVVAVPAGLGFLTYVGLVLASGGRRLIGGGR
ncbi:MAG: murein biosynthesis integral membrane protein MurJ [Anaerolineae bacterium]|nr:murein biosynthesis integral membrane protein MurJ [Anaerolineae bacterium]